MKFGKSYQGPHDKISHVSFRHVNVIKNLMLLINFVILPSTNKQQHFDRYNSFFFFFLEDILLYSKLYNL